MWQLLQDVGAETGVALLSGFIVWVLTTLGAVLALRGSAARIFRMTEPDRVTVVVSTSTNTETGSYRRSATGIGQVRALADISPRFSLAYRRKRLDNVFTCSTDLGPRACEDLVLLGGEKTNTLTWKVLERLREDSSFPVNPTPSSAIDWCGQEHVSAGDGAQLTHDYGLVLRCTNPFDPEATHRLLVLAGASTVGVHAAARILLRDRIFRRDRDLAVLVRARVDYGFPTTIEVVDYFERKSAGGPWLRRA